MPCAHRAGPNSVPAVGCCCLAVARVASDGAALTDGRRFEKSRERFVQTRVDTFIEEKCDRLFFKKLKKKRIITSKRHTLLGLSNLCNVVFTFPY